MKDGEPEIEEGDEIDDEKEANERYDRCLAGEDVRKVYSPEQLAILKLFEKKR